MIAQLRQQCGRERTGHVFTITVVARCVRRRIGPRGRKVIATATLGGVFYVHRAVRRRLAVVVDGFAVMFAVVLDELLWDCCGVIDGRCGECTRLDCCVGWWRLGRARAKLRVLLLHRSRPPTSSCRFDVQLACSTQPSHITCSWCVPHCCSQCAY